MKKLIYKIINLKNDKFTLTFISISFMLCGLFIGLISELSTIDSIKNTRFIISTFLFAIGYFLIPFLNEDQKDRVLNIKR